ncbi:MAG TPA: polysaccharide pyruvyl transferase CsaB [Abditibacteriaceae bacterium]
MNFFLSGYYGYDNAGDEAVLAAILSHIGAIEPQASFTVTAGDPAQTERNHGAGRKLRAIARQNPRQLVPAIHACDVFISGGGSLLQDVTSVRNVVYYTSLIRMARLSRKPVMIYAQGVGPLRNKISQKLARAAMQSARIITLRDEESAALLRRIGVGRNIQVTADPVWALEGGRRKDEGGKDSSSFRLHPSSLQTWAVGLRSWPGEAGIESTRRFVAALRDAANARGARLRFFPMQHPADFAILQGAGVNEEEIDGAPWRHPRETLQRIGECDLMIAMRLHALIFAGAVQVPSVAVNYDPKVASLARIMGAPLLENATPHELKRVPDLIGQARPMDEKRLRDLQNKARYNAELAVALTRMQN